MPEPPVINASPIIHLSRAGHADLLNQLWPRIIVPSPVADEVRAKSQDDVAAQALDHLSCFEVGPAVPIPPLVASWDLGRGEAAVLAWAVSHPGALVIIDDLQGRRCALSLGLPLIGTLAVVLIAKRKSLVPAARPVVEALIAHGMYLSTQVVRDVLALAEE